MLFTILVIVSAVAFLADILLRFIFKIKRFGFTKDFVPIKGKTIPIEDFIPYSFTLWLVFVNIFAITGLLQEKAGMPIFVNIPFSIIAAFIFNFALVHFIIKPLHMPKPLSDDTLTGQKAVVSASVTVDLYGTISFTKDGSSYTYDAVLADGGKDLPVGTAVIIIIVAKGLAFVEAEDSEELKSPTP